LREQRRDRGALQAHLVCQIDLRLIPGDRRIVHRDGGAGRILDRAVADRRLADGVQIGRGAEALELLDDRCAERKYGIVAGPIGHATPHEYCESKYKPGLEAKKPS
jgi:hypothetical protein